MLSDIKLSVIMLSVIMLSVIMLSVVAALTMIERLYSAIANYKLVTIVIYDRNYRGLYYKTSVCAVPAKATTSLA